MKALYLRLELNSLLCTPGPPFSLPLLCFPSFIYLPLLHFLHCFSSFTFPFWTTSCSFFLVLSASSSVDCGPAEPSADGESRSHQTDHLHIPIRSCFLLLTIRNGAVAPSPRSFCLTRRGRREITSGERERRLEYQMREWGLSEATGF